jgi:tetratricopeptide (TPR) repeat protein
MIRASQFTRFALLLLPPAAFLLVAAAPPAQQESPEELVRKANDLFRAGNTEAADTLYTAAEERTTDPGLVAFNRAAIHFERKQYREAENLCDRVLEDAECPPERAAKAWYNRGTCLLNRGGSMSVYRSAIACFEHTLDNPAADEPLKADARHNLELAKLLWLEEAKKEKKQDPPSPNDNIPPEEKRPQKQDFEPKSGNPETPHIERNGGVQPKTGMQGIEKKELPKQAQGENVGANNPNLTPIEDKQDVQQLSPEEARAYLKETSKWRKRQFHALLESLYGPDRGDVRDR